MSTDTTSTRDAILDHALTAINAHGVERLGMRDIARELGLSPGNLTYHFPTKEDLLIALAARLSDRNEQTEALGGMPDGLDGLLERFRTAFRNQVDFRGLVLALVHLHDKYPAIRAAYDVHQRRRTEAFVAMFDHLRSRGSLDGATEDGELQRLAGYCTLIGRFWISEAHIDGLDPAAPATHAHYLDLLATALAPHATDRGTEELARYVLRR